MLENLDIVLAFTMIMLLLSLLATIVVQMVVSLLGLRGKNLYWAVRQIVLQAAPAVETAAPEVVEKVEQRAGEIAGKVLGHAVLAPHAAIRKRLREGKEWTGRYGPTALRLKELKLIFDQLRSGGGGFQELLTQQAVASPPSAEWVDEVARRLKEAFPDQAGQLDQVARDAAAGAQSMGEVIERLEAAFPAEAARMEAVAKAALAEAGGWLEQIEDWFEMAMDAAHERFKMWSRWITAAAAAMLAFGFQIDSIDIIRQLSDQDVRTQVLSQIETVDALSNATLIGGGAGEDEAVQQAAKERHAQLEKALEETRKTLSETGLEIFGHPWWDPAHWRTEVRGLPDEVACNLPEGETDPSDRSYVRKAGGSLVTALLLSLGAPFWYGTFRKLLSLRSIVAAKHEADTTEKAGG